MKVISLIGNMRSGKDTSADYMVDKLNAMGYSVQREAFVIPLKAKVANILNVTIEELDRCKNENIYIDGYNVRKLLQTTADEIRAGDVYYFTNIMMDKIREAEVSGVDVFIITDMRLVVEQEILDGIATFVKIVRDTSRIYESGHNTELEVNKLFKDYTIDNNGSMPTLLANLDMLLIEIMK